MTLIVQTVHYQRMKITCDECQMVFAPTASRVSGHRSWYRNVGRLIEDARDRGWSIPHLTAYTDLLNVEAKCPACASRPAGGSR